MLDMQNTNYHLCIPYTVSERPFLKKITYNESVNAMSRVIIDLTGNMLYADGDEGSGVCTVRLLS